MSTSAFGQQWEATNHPHRATFRAPAKPYARWSKSTTTAWRGAVLAEIGAFSGRTNNLSVFRRVGSKATSVPFRVAAGSSNRVWVATSLPMARRSVEYDIYYGATEFSTQVATIATQEWADWSCPVQLTEHNTATHTPPDTLAKIQYMAGQSRSRTPRWIPELCYRRENAGGRRRGRDRGKVSVLRCHVMCPDNGVYGFAASATHTAFVSVDGVLAARSVGRAGQYGWSLGKGIELSRGPHLVEVYGFFFRAGDQARAGWRLPGAKEVSPIPRSALLPAKKASLIRVETRGSRLNAGFEFTTQNAYAFRGNDAVFTPVRFKDRSTGQRRGKVSYKWEFGDGNRGVGSSCEHVYVSNLAYNVTLTVSYGDITRTCKRVVDLRNVRPTQHQAFTIQLAEIPAVCYPDDIVVPSVRFRGKLSREILIELNSSIGQKGGATTTTRDTVVLAARSRKKAPVRLFSRKAGDLRSIEWQAVHHGIALSSERVLFEQAPFSKLPGKVQGKQLVDEDGAWLVLVPARVVPHSIDASLPAWNGESIVCLGDFEVCDSTKPHGSAQTKHISLPVTSDPSSVGSLLKFVTIPALVKDSASLIILRLGQADIGMAADVAEFERHMAALTDILGTRMRHRILLVTPPAYTPESARIRPYAVAISKVAVTRGIPVADLFTVFMCRRSIWSALFEKTPTSLSPAGKRLAASVIKEQLMKMRGGLGNAM